MLKEEFTGDLSKVPAELKIQYEYKLKTRDEHLKEMAQ
jgi:hypothetical protein